MAATGRVKAWRDLLRKASVVPVAWDRQQESPDISTPFCLSIKTVESLIPKNAEGNTEYQLRLSLFDLTYKQFFGRTWIGPVVRSKPAGQKSKLNYNKNVYLHTSLNDLSVVIVVEVVAIVQAKDGHSQQVACGWGMLRVFKYEGDMLDTSSSSVPPTQRLDIYHGSPRALLFLEDPIEDSPNLTLLEGCQLTYTIRTHKNLQKVMHLIPENIIFGIHDTIPGLIEGQKDLFNLAAGIDNLKKPRCMKQVPCYIEKVHISMTPALDRFEEDLCRQLNEDRINRENKVADGTMVQVMERRLKVGVHNGWSYIDEPEVVHLNMDTAGGSFKRGTPATMRRGSNIGHQRSPSTGSMNTVGNALVHKNRITLDGMVEDHMVAIIFILEYIIGEPIGASDRKISMAKSSSFTVAVRWAAWNPFTNMDSPDQSIQLLGGPSINPDSVFIYRSQSGEAASGSASSLLSVAGGTLNFSFVRERKGQDSAMPRSVSPQLAPAPGPLQKSLSQGSVGEDSAVLQEVGGSKRPPLPSKHGRYSSLEPAFDTSPRVSSSRKAGPPPPPRSSAKRKTGILEASPSPRPQQLTVPQQAHYSQEMAMGVPPHGLPPSSSPVPMYGPAYHTTPGIPYGMIQGSPRAAGYYPVTISTIPGSPMPSARMGVTTPDLQELPFTPVHAPIMAVAPGMHSGTGLSRAAYAKLYSAGFPPIQDRHGEAPDVVDPADHINFVAAKEEADRLQANEIVLQFLAFARMLSFDSGGAPPKQHSTVFFTFQFYRFPQVTTERLLLGNVEGELSADPNSLPCILQKLDREGSVSKGPPGYQVKYDVDPAYLKPGEVRLFVQHLYNQTLHIDVWDGDSLHLIGSCAVELKHLCRQGRGAVQVTYELDVVMTEYSEPDSVVPSGDVVKNGSVQPVESNNLLKGRLHLRLANVGHHSANKTTKAGTVPAPIKQKVVIPDDPSNNSLFPGGSLAAVTSHATALKKGKPAKAQHMVETNRELASVLFSRGDEVAPLEDSNREADSKIKRKLARMEMVRQREGSENVPLISSFRQEKEERERDLKTISLYRSQVKRDGILSMLSQAITTEHTINPSMGTTEFFEFVLKNPYNVQHTVVIECTDPELFVITDTREWRHFKMRHEIYTPVEEGMFNMETSSNHPEIFLRPKESVNIPFKFLSLKADHTVHPQGPNDAFKPQGKKTYSDSRPEDPLGSRLVKVHFKTKEEKPIAILLLHVEPQPHVIDQTFRFHHPEQSFLKKSIRLPAFSPIPGAPVGGGAFSQLYVRCSDSNIICESRKVQQGEPHDILLKVSCGASPHIKKFFVTIYDDPYLTAPIQIWQFYVHSLQRVDVSCVEGQTSRFTLILRGTQASRLVQCFSSHPNEMQLQPKEAFMLAANTVHEIHVGIRPNMTGSKFLFINVVDIEFHQLIRSWLVCVNSRAPLVSKAFELNLPVGGGKGSNKRISYTNPYPHNKVFQIRTNRPDLLQFKDTQVELGPGESQNLGLRFAPSQVPGAVEILVYINDEDDKNEETFCVRAIYE